MTFLKEDGPRERTAAKPWNDPSDIPRSEDLSKSVAKCVVESGETWVQVPTFATMRYRNGNDLKSRNHKSNRAIFKYGFGQLSHFNFCDCSLGQRASYPTAGNIS